MVADIAADREGVSVSDDLNDFAVLTLAQYDEMIRRLAEKVLSACRERDMHPYTRNRKFESFCAAAKLIRDEMFTKRDQG